MDFEPARGAEVNKRRPAIIVSNDEANQMATILGSGVLAVVPLTSNVARVYPFQVKLRAEHGLRVESKVQAEQIRPVDLERIGPVLGRLPVPIMSQVDAAIRLHLGV